MQRKDTHSIWIDLTIFSCVFAFSLFSGKRLFSHPDLKHKSPNSRRGPAEDLENNDSRTPASLQSYASNESVLQVGCVQDGKNKSMKTNLSLVRLSGELCFKGKKVKDGSAVNVANGAEINAFIDPAAKKLATNYFPLQSGKNTIQLEFVLSNGKKQTSEIEIEKI